MWFGVFNFESKRWLSIYSPILCHNYMLLCGDYFEVLTLSISLACI